MWTSDRRRCDLYRPSLSSKLRESQSDDRNETASPRFIRGVSEAFRDADNAKTSTTKLCTFANHTHAAHHSWAEG